MKTSTVPAERIERAILVLRGHKVLLDADLAALYSTTTKRLNEQVRRNRGRFPADFMFQLTNQELAALRSQFATSNERPGRGGRRYLPFAFTEHGALMAAHVINTARAIEASLYVVRAFVRLRRIIASNKELACRLDELEADTDARFRQVFEAIRQLMAPPEPIKRPIGFVTLQDKGSGLLKPPK